MERSVVAIWCCVYTHGCVQRDFGHLYLHPFSRGYHSAFGDIDRDGCAGGDRYFYRDSYFDSHGHFDGDVDSDGHFHRDKYADPHTHAYRNAHLDTNGHGDGYRNCDGDTLYPNTYADVGSHLHAYRATSASAAYTAAADAPTASAYRHAITADPGADGDRDSNGNTAWHRRCTVGGALSGNPSQKQDFPELFKTRHHSAGAGLPGSDRSP